MTVEGVCGFYGKGDHVIIIFRAIYCGWLRLPFAIFNNNHAKTNAF